MPAKLYTKDVFVINSIQEQIYEVGRHLPEQARCSKPSIEEKFNKLEAKLAEVKQLYQQKYGQDVDEEDSDVHYDADGTPWIQTSGTGVATDLRVDRLEQMLSVVKDLYSEKYGRDVDTEYDADGTALEGDCRHWRAMRLPG